MQALTLTVQWDMVFRVTQTHHPMDLPTVFIFYRALCFYVYIQKLSLFLIIIRIALIVIIITDNNFKNKVYGP